MKSPLRLVKYVIGLSLALIAVSNCFNVLSNSSVSTSFSADDASRIEAAKRIQDNVGLASLAGAKRSILEASRGGASISRAGLATKASALSPAASPFAPTVTATKSSMLPAGDTQADPGDTVTYTIVISNTGPGDATGVNFSDTIDPNTTLVAGSLIASPIAVDDSYNTIGNVNISVPAGQGVIANDSNPNGSGTLTVTKVNATPVPGGGSATAGTPNGSVTMSSDGSFTYTPNVAFRGPSDSFTYTLGNGTGKTDTATVTITVNGLIWFVDSAAAPGGDGRLSSPFNCLTGSGCFDPAAADIANDNIFLYSGSYTGGLTLLSGEKFIGQGASQSLLAITGLSAPSGNNLLPSTGGSNPTITSSANGVNLGPNNEIWGMTFGNATGAGISGSAIGTLKVRDTTINNGTGQALNLTASGTLDAIFQSISSTNSGTTGITLSTIGGTMSVSGSTTITNPTGVGIQVSAAPAGASLGFGNTTVSSSGGTGVSLVDNVGNVVFGALNISPDSGQRGLHATNGVLNSGSITATSGTISTTGATAVEVSRTSAGTIPLIVSLTSISANGGTSGIVLANTSGSFAVTGTGSANSGGLIQGTTDGILLNNATNVSLTEMRILTSSDNAMDLTSVNTITLDSLDVTTTANHGIVGTTVTDFKFQNGSTMTGAGNGANEFGIFITNLFGSNSAITNSSVTGSQTNNVRIVNNSATAGTLTITNSSLGTTPVGTGGDAVSVQTDLTGNLTVNLTGGNNLNNNQGDGIQASANNSSTLNVTVNGATSNYNGNLGSAVNIAAANSASIAALVSGFTGLSTGTTPANGLNVINIQNLDTSTINATVQSNTISGLGNNASGIRVIQEGNGTINADINNNTISGLIASGILAQARLGTGRLNLTINNNIVNLASVSALDGVNIESGSGALGFTNTICLNMFNNTSSAAAQQGYRLRQRPVSTFNLQNFAGSGLSAADVTTWVNTTKSNIGTTDIVIGTAFTNAPANCSTAMLPMSAPIQVQSLNSSARKVPAPETDEPETKEYVVAAEGIEPTDTTVANLSERELLWMVQQALARWRAAGISAEDLARLEIVTFEIADLPRRQLAAATSTHVKIDETAAGFGWYSDQFALEDSEFEVPVPGEVREAKDRQVKEREAMDSNFAAHGRMDLLTVVMRQLGFVYLQGKDGTPKRLRPLMLDTLRPSVRRTLEITAPASSTSRVSPGVGQSLNSKVIAAAPAQPKSDSSGSPFLLRPAVFNPRADLIPGSYAQNTKRMSYAANARRVGAFTPAVFSGETVTLSIGTIPAGESVTIMFQVTIDNPFPAGVCTITNQGHVTGTNFSQVDTNIDVITMVGPVAIGACPANITTSTDPGLCTKVVNYTTPTASGCPAATVTCNPPSGFAFPKGTTTVTCTATNGTSPDSTCTFTVEVKDTEAPTCNLPANITQNNDAGQCQAAVVTYTATASDNCGSATIVCTPASGTTFAVGATTVNCTASDDSPDSPDTNCSFTVTVKDTEAPTCNLPANITQNNDSGQCSAVVTYTATASDNCPGSTIVCNPASGSTFPLGTTTVNCTASDNSPDSPDTNCSFTVTVKDTQAPTMTACPSNISVTSGGGCQIVNYTPPTATDNCGSATVSCSPPSGFCFPPGTTTVTCTASDTSPDSPDSTCSFTVTVVPCTITCPSDITTGNNPGQCGASVTFTPTTAGAGCGTVTCAPASGSFFPVGTTPVTCSTQAGPSCNFSVTVRDTEPPAMAPCPPNVIVATGNPCQVVTYANPTATDNCGSATVNCSPPSGTCFAPGTTTVTCTASDTSPHSPDTSCSFTVTVVPCAITCPGNITRQNDAGLCGASVTFAPSSSAGCGTVTCSPSSGSFFPVGTTTVTCTTSAGPGCSFTVTVTDAQGPNITTTTQPIELWPPNHKYETVTISQLVVSATDNCSGNVIGNVVIASVSSDEPENGSGDGNTVDDIVIAGNCKSVQLRAERDGGSNGRVYTIVLKVTDAAGNVGTASRTVTVPHSQGGGPAILGPGPGYSETGTCP